MAEAEVLHKNNDLLNPGVFAKVETYGDDESSSEGAVEDFEEVSDDFEPNAAGATTKHNQSNKPGKQRPGSYDKWADAPFPGLFYKTQEFEKLCDLREKKLSAAAGKKVKVDRRSAIPKGGKSVKLERDKTPIEFLFSPEWVQAAQAIVREKTFIHPDTNRRYTAGGIVKKPKK